MPKKPAPAEESRPLTLPAPDVDVLTLTDAELIAAAIACTPDPLKPGRAIPATRFAADVAQCNERTLRRYLSGERDLDAMRLLRETCRDIVRAASKKASRAKAS